MRGAPSLTQRMRGFTLVEVAIAVAVVASLAGAVAVVVQQNANDAASDITDVDTRAGEAQATADAARATLPDGDGGDGGGTPAATLAYGGSITFLLSQTEQLSAAPTTSGLDTPTFSLEGTLPDGVSFDTATGQFTGPAAWNFEAVQISAGFDHTCAVLDDGTARCWGKNGGRLGNGTTSTFSAAPVAVSGLTGISSISAGDHTCAVLNDGTAHCWGTNVYGQLGDGTTALRSTPVPVSGLTGVVSISAGYRHTCAALDDGTAHCWGESAGSRLGDGWGNVAQSTPRPVSGLTGASPETSAVSISAGYDHSCAALADGTARCWGATATGSSATVSRTVRR